jgi:hypothetical protein
VSNSLITTLLCHTPVLHHFLWKIPPSPPNRWEETSLPSVFQHTLAYFQHRIGAHPLTQVQCDEIAEEIANNTLLTSTDGAYCPNTNKGSHSCVMASKVQYIIAPVAGPDNGHPDLVSSYQSELGGIIATSFIISRIWQHYNIQSGKANFFVIIEAPSWNPSNQWNQGLHRFLVQTTSYLKLQKYNKDYANSYSTPMGKRSFLWQAQRLWTRPEPWCR